MLAVLLESSSSGFLPSHVYRRSLRKASISPFNKSVFHIGHHLPSIYESRKKFIRTAVPRVGTHRTLSDNHDKAKIASPVCEAMRGTHSSIPLVGAYFAEVQGPRLPRRSRKILRAGLSRRSPKGEGG